MLYSKVYDLENLKKAYLKVEKWKKHNPVLAGELSRFDRNFKENLLKISQTLAQRDFYPPAPEIIYKIKKDGGLQAYGLFPLRERIVLLALYQVLEPYWERRFLDTSLGYRKGYSRHSVLKLFEEAKRVKRHWVLTTDIQRFFDNVDYSVMDEILKGSPFRLSKDLRSLILSFFKAPVKEAGMIEQRERGGNQPLKCFLSPSFQCLSPSS